MPTLVVNQGALGDLLISLPAMRLIRKHSGGRITLSGKPENALFLKTVGECESVIPSTSTAFAQLYAGMIHPLLQYFDEVWWFTRRRGLVPDIFLMPDAKVKAKVIFTVDERADGLNCTKFQFNNVAKFLGISEGALKEYLTPIDYSHTTGLNLECHLAIHPGSGSQKKNAPIELFFDVAKRMKEQVDGFRCIFFTGPAEEKGLSDTIEEFAMNNSSWVKLIVNQPIEIVGSLLSKAKLFLGNDSGISHLAAWSGSKTFMLFGPTSPELWAPPLDNVKIIRSQVRCSPCGDYYRKCTETICMEQFKAKEIANILLKELEKI